MWNMCFHCNRLPCRGFCGRSRGCSRQRSRWGFTLLELLVATSLLVLGLGAIMRLMLIAQTHSVAASELTVVQLACQSKVAELLASDRPISPETPRFIVGVRAWTLEVRLVPGPHSKLATLHLTARKHLDPSVTDGPVVEEFHLIRWVPRERVRFSAPEGSNFLPAEQPETEFLTPFY